MTFEPEKYGPIVSELLSPGRLMELGPGSPNRAAYATLKQLRATDLFDGIGDSKMANACLSGLWLYHDFLDESHTISQSIETPTGSYWHGIMHRREPDYGNSKYWFRRVGDHPIFAELCREAASLCSGSRAPSAARLASLDHWDPFAFVDLCQSANGRGDEAELLCRQIQLREWELLFDFSYQQAVAE